MPADITHEAVALYQPRNKNIRIWRYLDVTKLVALMETQSLHFTRADRLDDPFEGSLPLGNQIAEEKMVSRMFKDQRVNEAGKVRYTHAQLREEVRKSSLLIKRWIFVNCWHSGDTESVAMWKQYGPTTGSVAIQSTYGRLMQNLPTTGPEIATSDGSANAGPTFLGMSETNSWIAAVISGANPAAREAVRRAAGSEEQEIGPDALFQGQ